MHGLNNTPAYAKDEISSIGASELGSSKCDLVAERGTNPHEHFGQKYGKWWPLRLIKTINLLLCLAITIGAVICALHGRLGWSRCWGFVRSFYSNNADWTHPDRIILISAFVLALTFFTCAMHWIGKKKLDKSQKTMASIGVTDICLSLLMASMLVPILFSFTCRSIAVIRWFYPRLLNESMTLAELVEWDEDRRGYHPYGGRYEYDDFGRSRLTTTPLPVPTTPAPWIVRQQEERKYSIMLRLWMDPTIALFTFLAIFLNLVYGVRLLLLFKRTKVWSSDYRGMHPNCSKLDITYANFWPFGLLKVVHWLLPLISVYIYFYMNNHEFNYANMITAAVLSIIWFVQWVSYLQKVGLHPGDMDIQQQQKPKEQQQQHGLVQMVKKDLIYSGVAIFIYFILSFIFLSPYAEIIRWLLNISIFVHAASVLFTVLLLKRHGGPNAYSGFGLKIPGVTVNISINIQKKDDATSANQQQQNAVGNANMEEGGENVNAQKGVENI